MKHCSLITSPYIFLFFPPFLHPIPFWLAAPNNLSPFNDMQMNFHEPHDPMRWLNWDDISCHAAATLCFCLPIFCLPISTIFLCIHDNSQLVILTGFIVNIPFPSPFLEISFVRSDILHIRCYFREVFPMPAEMANQRAGFTGSHVSCGSEPTADIQVTTTLQLL